LSLARELAAAGHAVAVVLHDVNLADRVVVLSGGRGLRRPASDRDAHLGMLSNVNDHPVTVVDRPRYGGPLVLVGA
jgi:iron complex transport system ATP-binding protein